MFFSGITPKILTFEYYAKNETYSEVNFICVYRKTGLLCLCLTINKGDTTTFMRQGGIFKFILLLIHFGDVFKTKNGWINYKFMKKSFIYWDKYKCWNRGNFASLLIKKKTREKTSFLDDYIYKVTEYMKCINKICKIKKLKSIILNQG